MAFHWKCLSSIVLASSGLCSANQEVFKGIGSLIEKHASSAGAESAMQILNKAQRAVDGFTPGAQEAYSAALTDVIKEIDENVASKIRIEHAETQATINSRLQTLETTTQVALDNKMSADGEDGVWVSCRETERDRLRIVEAKEAAVRRALAAQEAPCALQAREAPFRRISDDEDLSFRCDIRLKGQCDNRLAAFNRGVDGVVSSLEGTFGEERAEYLSAKSACDQAKAVVANAQATLQAAMQSFETQVSECIQQGERRELSICTFGSSLTTKCAAKAAFETLNTDISSRGTEFSEADRRNEWGTTQITKCMLQLLVNAGTLANLDVGNEELHLCAASVNYDQDVGTLTRSQEAFTELTSEESFSCLESEIGFSGFTWIVPDSENVTAAQYQMVDHRETVVGDRSTKFAFCTEPNPVSRFFARIRTEVTNLMQNPVLGRWR